jgi:hypothetical protein
MSERKTYDETVREFEQAKRALRDALLVDPPGRFVLWLVDQLAKRLPA